MIALLSDSTRHNDGRATVVRSRSLLIVPRLGSPYGQSYARRRRALLAARPRCALRLVCDGAPATSADHDPPLARHRHLEGTGCCRLQPACTACQKHQGGMLRTGRALRRIPEPSRAW